ARLALSLPENAVPALLRHVALLLKWNRSIKLTSGTAPLEVGDNPLLDSLSAAHRAPSSPPFVAECAGCSPGLSLRAVGPHFEFTLPFTGAARRIGVYRACP